MVDVDFPIGFWFEQAILGFVVPFVDTALILPT